MWIVLKKSAIVFVVYKILKFLFGRDIDLWMNRYFTRQYVIRRMPKIIKITGPTGVGKDTTAVAMAINIRKEFKRVIKERLIQIEQILYQINFKQIDVEIIKNYQFYIITDPDIYEKEINKYISSNNLILKSYKHMWDWNMIYNSYVKKELINKYLRYAQYKNIHIVEMIKEYIQLRIRLQIDNYIMSNQPLREDEHLMAKLFSTNFLKISHDDDLTYNKKLYKEKVQFPFIPYMVIYETEADAWWNNIDPGIRQDILKFGVRNFKAFQRHILGENVYWIQVGQNAGRTNKLLRELDHAVINVVDKIENDGHPKTRFILSFVTSFISLLILLTKPIKYVSHRLKHINSKVYNIKEKLKDYGNIEVDIVISNNEETGTIHEIKIEDIMAKRMFRTRYSTRLTFKSSDTRGRYNTHYLDIIAKDLKKKSEINILGVPNWPESLVMEKEQGSYINSGVLNKSLQIEKEDILKKFYKMIKDLSEKD
jgi:DNA polymerase III delta prime subunit